jgi:hypothetical protein
VNVIKRFKLNNTRGGKYKMGEKSDMENENDERYLQ